MDEPDPDIDFGHLISEQRLERWQSAAGAVGVDVKEWIPDVLDQASAAIERTTRPPAPRDRPELEEIRELTEAIWGRVDD